VLLGHLELLESAHLVVRRSVDREHTFEDWCASSSSSACPQGLAHRPHGALGTSQGRRFRLHPPAHGFAQFCGTEIRPARPVTPSARARWSAPFVTSRNGFSKNARRPEHPPAWPSSTSGRPLARGARPCPGAPRHRSHSRRTTGCRSAGARCPARRRFDTAYVEARRVHVAIPKSSGAACAIRCHHAAWASASKCAKRWRGPASRSAGPESTWPPTPSPTSRNGSLGCAALPRSSDGRPVAQPGRHLSIVVPDDPPAATLPLRLDIAGDVDVDVPDLARYETDGARS